ncbi:MAG: diguanylate cyclase domain-containing protein [Janthinobacterium lividum]
MNQAQLITPRRSLEQVLRNAHLGVALIAVLMAAMTLMIAGLIAVRIYSEENLLLVARSMSYTVEAAVVFGDANAAAEALAVIGANEDIAEASVYGRNGHLLASWKDPQRGPRAWLEKVLAAPLLPKPLVFPIMRNDNVIGQIRLRQDGGGLLLFLGSALLAVMVCMALSTLVALLLAKRMQAGITRPLRALANVAHRVRRERDFALRAPTAEIAEFNELNADFNALLDELETWQKRLQKENASLEHRANHDSLTGLSNRAFLEDQLEQAVNQASLADGRVAVMFLDIDHFKQINDQHGHAAGDSVLVAIAARMKSQLREGDLVARLGGDEFAILLQALRNTDDALHIADKILGEMRVPIDLPEGGRLTASLSIGVAVFPDHGSDPQSVLAAADRAMYQSKQQRGTRHLAA